jgi:NAD(P)-dependent dehydrogenase (short-subunit alcohol dehydrogenase family)
MGLTLTYPEGGMLVTGGTGNVGGGIVRQLARAGVPLVFTYQSSRERAEKLAANYADEGYRVTTQAMDLTDSGSIEAALDRVVDEYGAIHGVALGAGAMIPFGRLADITVEDVEAFMAQDAIGYFRLFQAAVHRFRDTGGTITACSTQALNRVVDFDGMSPFSKGSVDAMIRQVAAEEGHRGIRANGVAIGWIEQREWQRSSPGDTVVAKPGSFESIEDYLNSILHQISDMTRIPRIGRPEEAGNLFAFLASNEASYVNGQVIAVDGGSSL